MEGSKQNESNRIALVTGANRGIGHETVKQLAKEGILVVLTSRDENRGKEAVKSLNDSGLLNVIFHQLDVQDPTSVSLLGDFIKAQFGRLDILVNNAGASGVEVDVEGLKALNIDSESWLSGRATNLVQGVIQTTYEEAEICLNTNYYGCKRVIEALIPLLKLSTSGARIVNVSSIRGELRRIPNIKIREEMSTLETLTEDKLDLILQSFLKDVKEGKFQTNGWSTMLPAYSISKAVLNAYTRILAKRYPNMCINCVHPGFVRTELNWNTGILSVEEGAQGPVMAALLPNGGPSGCYFDQTKIAPF